MYAWQSTEIEMLNLSENSSRNIDTLRQRVSDLTQTEKADKATLQVQKQQIDQTAAQLADLKKQYDQASTDLTSKVKQLQTAQDQLSKNAAELAQLRSQPPLFSFQNKSTTLQNVTTKEEQIKQLITDAFSYVQNLYGQPYLLHSITITFVDQFSIAGSSGEILISNSSQGINIDIHLKDFNNTNFQDINTVIHEMIHGFHGVAVFDTSALEEGITVAMTDAVMERMIQDNKLPHFNQLYISMSDETYAQMNRTLTIPADSTAFYSRPDISQIYQVIGKAWYRLYQEDASVFHKINDYYYPRIQNGQKADAALVRDAIKSALPSVGSQSISTYLSKNVAFNPS